MSLQLQKKVTFGRSEAWERTLLMMMPFARADCAAGNDIFALRTHSAVLWFKVGLSKSFHQVILADLLYECNGNHIHDMDIL